MEAVADDQKPTTVLKTKRNWWKIGFFIALLAFEVTREIAVISADAAPRPNTNFTLFHYDGYVSAQGSWKRIDGGGKLVTSSVTIECRKERGECLEAYSNTFDGYVYAPQIDWFPARFTPDGVSYENDQPECANYSVRIDVRLKKVLAVRERKAKPSNELCRNLEPRIEMQLADGYEYIDPVKEHFVPVLNILAAMIRAFDK